MKFFLLIASLCFLLSCHTKSDKTLFDLMIATGINFNNKVIDGNDEKIDEFDKEKEEDIVKEKEDLGRWDLKSKEKKRHKDKEQEDED